MSGRTLYKENKNSNKEQLTENSNESIPKQKKVNLSIDENIFQKQAANENRTTESSDILGNESQTEFNDQISKGLNIFNEYNSTLLNNKIPKFDYLIYNEQYEKQKYQEGNKYKENSKNFILKNNANSNNTALDNIDYNKENDILKAIKFTQQNINNSQGIKNMNIVYNQNLDLNYKSNLIKENICQDSNRYSLCSYINNYKFHFCK